MTDFFKDDDIFGEYLSDVSEVDPDELNKILKSANELDRKYHLADQEDNLVKKKSSEKNLLKIKPDFLTNEEDLEEEEVLEELPRALSLFEESPGPIGYGTRTDYKTAKNIEKRPKNTANWLGLEETPASPHVVDDLMQRKISLSPSAEKLLKSVEKEEGEKDLKMMKSEKSSESDIVLPVMTQMASSSSRPRNKNKGILMSELFGDMTVFSNEPDIKIGVESSSPTVNNDANKKVTSYNPSSADLRRSEKRPEMSSTSNIAGSGTDRELDWLLGTKSPAKENISSPGQNLGDRRPRTAAPLTSTPLSSAAPASTTKSKIPDWLEDIVQDSSQPKKETSVREDSKKLPEWLGGPPQKEKPSETLEAPQSETVHIQNLPQEKTEIGTSNIISKLASVQTELVAAMSKRSENLQNYMKELMHEAQRVTFAPDNGSRANSHTNGGQEKNHNPAIENVEEEKNSTGNNEMLEELKHKEDLLHDLEMKANRLELQNEHLEMKIENLISTHLMEIESLKQRHGFELSSWETRLDRMKNSLDEAKEEYEEKIIKLKERESELISEHKGRIEKLEEERLADLNKLGEFHRLAIEQAASFTMTAPNLSQVIRLPLKAHLRPKDEVELSERESTLLEKEKQVELLKATLEALKRELDEALEVDKIHREDRERELRRQTTEARLREEARQAESKRERDQLEAMATQIKIMRNEALKEQGEIAKEKLELAAERARLEATYSIQGRTEGSIPPLDIMQARAEVEAALETARQAKEAAELERRRQSEMRQTVEQITWEQKEMDLRLETREKHVNDMLKSAEKLRNEGLAAIAEAKSMKEEMEEHQQEMKEQLRQIETKERVLAKERLEIAKEKIELERRKTQLELILPELNPAEELTIHPPKVFVDPKAVIMRLKAEKELESFMSVRK